MRKRNNGDVIVEYLKKNPGRMAQQIVTGTGLAVGSVKSNAVELARLGTLRRVQQPNAHGVGRQEYVYSYNPTRVLLEGAQPTKKSEGQVTMHTNPVVIVKPEVFRQSVPSTPIPLHPYVPPVETLDKKVADLVEAILARITDEVREGLAREVPKIVGEVTQTYVHPKEKPKLRKIFIGGAIPKQVPILQKEFEGVCDLVFAGSDESCGVWQSRAKEAYAAIVWTDFVSHKHSDYLTSAGVKPVTYTGGITLLKDKIMELCV